MTKLSPTNSYSENHAEQRRTYYWPSTFSWFISWGHL